jgi:hypothetical protein
MATQSAVLPKWMVATGVSSPMDRGDGGAAPSDGVAAEADEKYARASASVPPAADVQMDNARAPIAALIRYE